jgi:hypothetical protein
MYIYSLPETRTCPLFFISPAQSVLFDEGHSPESELVKCKQAVLRPNMCWRPFELSMYNMCECFLSEHTLCALSAVPSNEFPAASFILSFSHQQKVVIIYSARIFFTHRHAASQNHHSTSNQQKRFQTSI